MFLFVLFVCLFVCLFVFFLNFIKTKRQKGELFNAATPWHRDLMFLPIDSNAFVTFWCVLSDIVAPEDAVLQYAEKSHADLVKSN